MYHVMIPTACEYITLYGKRDFANVIKIKDLKMGILDNLVEPSLNTWVLKNRESFLAVVR